MHFIARLTAIYVFMATLAGFSSPVYGAPTHWHGALQAITLATIVSPGAGS